MKKRLYKDSSIFLSCFIIKIQTYHSLSNNPNLLITLTIIGKGKHELTVSFKRSWYGQL